MAESTDIEMTAPASDAEALGPGCRGWTALPGGRKIAMRAEDLC